jgi:hypothetical protein
MKRRPGPLWCAPLCLFLLALSSISLPAQVRNPFAQRRPAPARDSDANARREQLSGEHREHDGPEQMRKREDWFYRQRAFPLKRIPPGARLNGLRQMEAMVRAQQRTGSPSGPGLNANANTWTLIGPQNVQSFNDNQSGAPNATGRITALAVDPRNANVVYAGAAQGGVWKSTDGGQNWTPLTDQQASLAVGAMAIAPSAPDTIYVGTGEFNLSFDAYYGVGVLKSTDGGQNWTYLPGAFTGPNGGPLSTGFFGDGGGAYFGAIAVHPTNPNIVLASVFKETDTQELSGVYRSIDGGVTWTRVLNGFTFQVVFDSTGTNAYTGLGYCTTPGNDCVPDFNAAGFYKSTSSGASWSKVNNFGLSSTNTFRIGRVALGVAPSSSTTLFAAIGDSSPNASSDGVFKSTDGGVTWNEAFSATNDFCGPQCDYDMVIAVHPTNPNTVFVGGSNPALNGIGMFFRSLNGAPFTDVSGNVNGLSPARLHVDEHAIAFSADGSKMYVGNDGGVWSTTDALNANVTWTGLNNNLATLQFYPGMAVSPADVNFILGGTQDNSTLRYTGNPSWEAVTCGDGAFNLIDPNTPTTVYASCFDDGSVQKSVQNGNRPSWVDIFPAAGDTALLTPLAMDPSNSNRLYAGTTQIFRSEDGGVTWSVISSSLLGPNAFSGFDAVTAIAPSPTDPGLVFASTSDGVVRFARNAPANTLTNWTPVFNLPGRWVTSLAVSPRNGTAYVGLSGFSGFSDNAGHVFSVTLNGNTPTLTDISSNLPNIPVNDVIVDPDVDNTLYIGTDVGVFYTTNNGASWTALVNGLPRSAVMSLRLHRATRTLIAGTHGRSAWTLISPVAASGNPAPTLTSLQPNNVTAGSAGFQLTVNGTSFVNGAAVQWNGSARTTTFVGITQLKATITAADVAAAGSVNVTVANPAPGGGASNALVFTINPPPAPVLSSISPGTVVANSGGFTLTVNGASFTPSSVVGWNGAARTTTFVSSTQLTATILASDVAAAGTAAVSVFTPAPGGGTSSLVTFFVTAGNTVPAALTQARYWPHIIAGTGFVTKMTVTNLTNAANDVLIYLTSQGGQTLKTTSLHLAPAGTARIATLESDRFGALQIQWAIVNSQADVTINLFFEFIANQNTGAIVNTVGFNDAPGLTAFTVPVEFEPPPPNFGIGRTIGIAIANPGNVQATVTIKLLDINGTVVATLTRNVPPFGQISFPLETTPEFSAVLPNGNFLGSIAVTSTQPVSAIALEDDLGPFSAIPVVSGTAK